MNAAASRSFELHILSSMTTDVREPILSSLRMTHEEADRMGANSPIKLPDNGKTPASEYERVLGRAVAEQTCPLARDWFEGSVRFSFVLTLWPHLFWVVHQSRSHMSWSVGFENQHNSARLSPDAFRPGMVTLSLIAQAAKAGGLHDGWDQNQTHRFEFAEGHYEGDFAWGLLQKWRRLD